MKTFLFTWNPNKWNWTTLEQSIDHLEQTGRTIEKWTVSAHRKIQPGDRAFLMRLGKEPKGIMAAGYVDTPPFLSKHWIEDKLVHRVMIDFESIINPEKEQLLSLDILNQGNLEKVTWTPQSSGVEINSDVVDELEAVWFDFLTNRGIGQKSFIETERNEQLVYTEGMSNQVLVTKYERNRYARKTCINYHGLSCSVCKFNFEKRYGELGKDFIHVHHLRRVADIGTEYIVDPIKDLRPVCPNCHAMIHKRKDPYTIDELKDIIQEASS